MIKRILVVQLLLGGVYSAILFVLVYAAAWKNLPGRLRNRPSQYTTEYHVTDLIRVIDEHQKTNGALPVDLNDLGDSMTRLRYDGWGRPLIYKVTGETFTVTSLGRDGRPGGEGIDADLSGPSSTDHSRSNLRIVGQIHSPTFEQFLTTDDEDEISGSSVRMYQKLAVSFGFGLIFVGSFEFWYMGFRDLVLGMLSKIMTLSSRRPEQVRRDNEIRRAYFQRYAVLDRRMPTVARLRSLADALTMSCVLVFCAMGFSLFIIFFHIKHSH